MAEHIVNREVASLIAHLRIKEHLQQQIAQFFGKIRPMLPLDRVEDLVGLFQGVFADRGKTLLAIPRAAAGRTEPRHDRNTLLKQCAGGVRPAAILQAHAFTLTRSPLRKLLEFSSALVPVHRASLYCATSPFSSSSLVERRGALPMLTIEIIFAVLVGLAFGSFLNVCISRLPRHASVVRPPSHCPRCRAPIAVRDNIPLISYFLLRGRCRNCRKRIAWRYPFVEAAVAALTVGNLLYTGLAFETVAFTIFCALVLALAVCDAETMQLPDALTLPLLGLGILYRASDGLFGEMHRGAAFAWHSALILGLRGAISAAATAVALLLLRWIYWLVRRRQGLGMGDVKLAAAIAAWLGARQMCVVLFLAVVTGALTALVVFARIGSKEIEVRRPSGCPVWHIPRPGWYLLLIPWRPDAAVVSQILPLRASTEREARNMGVRTRSSQFV